MEAIVAGDDDQDPARCQRPVSWRARDLSGPTTIAMHRHHRAQLLYASEGVMTARTAEGMWVVPPQQAVWIPSAESHEVAANGPLKLRSLYFEPSRVPAMPSACTVVAISPLMRELILAVFDLPILYQEDGPGGRLLAVILDQIATLPPAPLHLSLPTDRRVRPIAHALIDDPSDPRPLATWAKQTGGSERTLARIFKRETGMTFGQWRQQARLHAALPLLADGAAVGQVAADLGYESQSAFITMFRKALGTTPRQYFAAARRDDDRVSRA